MNPIQYFKTAIIASKLLLLLLLAANIAVHGPLWGIIHFLIAFVIGWYGTWGILVLLERKHKK